MRGNTPRHAEVAVTKVEDVVEGVRELLGYLDRILADDHIDRDEARGLVDRAGRLWLGALEAQRAAEITDVGELLTLSSLKGERPSGRNVQRAHELGIQVVTMSPTPLHALEPRDAA